MANLNIVGKIDRLHQIEYISNSKYIHCTMCEFSCMSKLRYGLGLGYFCKMYSNNNMNTVIDDGIYNGARPYYITVDSIMAHRLERIVNMYADYKILETNHFEVDWELIHKEMICTKNMSKLHA